MDSKILWWLYGLVVGDMLGVPYEFFSREELKNRDIVLTHGGWWNVPVGTWSDDSSLMLCLAESLCDGYDLVDISAKMIDWKHSRRWVATGKRFDIGNQTSVSLDILAEILESKDYECLQYMRYEAGVWTNGNGSLMKILPLYWYIRHKDLDGQFEIIWQVSALTHPHIFSAICCFLYLRMAHYIVIWEDKFAAYHNALQDFSQLHNNNTLFEEYDLWVLEDILSGKIFLKNFNEIQSGGFVVETLEVAIWSLLNTENYHDAIVACIRFGDDTDTTAAICWWLAGIYYGFENIPSEWRDAVLKKEEILALIDKFSQKYQ